MRNKKIKEYREILRKTLDGSKCRMGELKEEIQIATNKYKKEVFGKTDSERHKLFKEIFGNLPEEERKLTEFISRLEIELLEKKFANKVLFSDVEPYEVIEEKTTNLYLIRSMKSSQTKESKTRLKDSFIAGGFVGTYDNYQQEWEISSDCEGETIKIRRHKDGKFYDSTGIEYVISSKPQKFYDFNF